MQVAYLINQYPKPSHSFIRSEMRELERLGLTVRRVSLRGWSDEAVSAVDQEEQERTTYILKQGPFQLLAAALKTAVGHPGAFVSALRLALSFGRASDVGTLKHLFYFVEACWFAGWTAKHVQHVHAHFGTNTATIALLAHRLGGAPFSFTVHGPEEFDKPLSLRLEAKIASARFVVAITSFCRSQLFRWAPLSSWTNVKLIRCTPDREFMESTATPVPKTGSFVCVGRLCEQKGQLLLLEAIAQLRRSGALVSLVLAGDGPMRSQVEEAIDRLGLTRSVRITGWIGPDQVRNEILAADAMILPSFAEGLPIVIMEAMALGRPVISTMIAGIPELVESGVDGFLVPAGDVESLSEAIRHYTSLSSNERQQIADSARSKVRQMHDPQQEARKLEAAFRSAYEGASKSVVEVA